MASTFKNIEVNRRGKFWGSTVALLFGWLAILGGFSQITSGTADRGDSDIGGAVMVLGALSYRSLKRRRLGIKPDTRTRQSLEIACLTAALLIVMLGRAGKLFSKMNYNPVTYLVIPLWALTAYSVVFFKRPKRSAQGDDPGRTDVAPRKGVIYTETELKEFRKRGYSV